MGFLIKNLQTKKGTCVHMLMQDPILWECAKSVVMKVGFKEVDQILQENLDKEKWQGNEN